MKKLITLYFFLGVLPYLFAQSGPAGVGSSTNNVLWLKADAGTSTTTNGSAVSSWNDQSGNGINVSQSTAAQRPLYRSSVMNGMPAIEFDNSTTSGQNDMLTAPDNALLDNTAGYTAFTVIRMGTLTGGGQSIFAKRNTIDVDEAFMFFFFSSNRLYLDIDGLGNRFNTTNTYTTNTNYLLGFMFDGSLSSSVRSKIMEGDSTRVSSTETSTTVGDKPSPLVIGATHSSDNRGFGGHISEIILYRTALNNAERTIVNNYLSAKYNIPLLLNDKYAGDNTANGDFDFDVAGVGKESSGSTTTFDASVTKGLRLSVVSGLDNGDYIMVGNKYANNWQKTTDIAGISGTNPARWERVWYMDVTNTGTNITADIEFDFSDAGIGVTPGTASNYVLLFRATNSGTWTELGTANAVATDRVKFNGYTFTTDGYYTLGTTNYSISPLPVSLVSFEAMKKSNAVDLSWKTLTETNNKFFTLERSSDAVNYKVVGTVSSKSENGNSNSFLNYNFLDSNPDDGINYYRLSQTDINGDSKMYPPVSIVFEREKNITFVLYPNPNKGSCKLDLTGIENNHEIEISIFDISGREVYSNTFFTAEANANSFDIVPEKELSNGAYIVRVTAEGVSYTIKMQVEK